MTGRLRVFIVLLVVAASAAAPGAQVPDGPRGGQRTPARALPPDPQAPQGTAVMRGQIVASDTGAPIRRAQVRVSGAGRQSRLATTDPQGRFEVRGLAAGRYTLSASKGGFVTLQYGQRRPGESGTPLELAEGQVLDKLVVGLPRGSVITGRVTDEYGEPVVNATVTALAYGYSGGVRRLRPAGARDTTDDLGQYRLFGLQPGDYVVSAALRASEVTDPGGEPSGYAPTYYPGTLNVAEAQTIPLALAQENTTVSFGLIATRLVRLSGLVMRAAGGPATSGVVVLAGADGAGGAGAFRGAGGGRIGGDGTFRIANVAPGRYQLQVRTGGRGDGEFARMDLMVGSDDIEGLTLVATEAGRLSGTVMTDTGDALPTGSPGIQVTARPASPEGSLPGAGGGGPNQGRVGPDGRFELANLTDPRVIRVSTPSGWMLKSVLLNGQDVTDAPLDVPPGQAVGGLQIFITRKVSAITGTVYDARKQPVLDATVVIFPVDEGLRGFQSRFIRAARPNQEGTFTVATLPPGNYLAIALQGLEDGQSADPAFLASIENLATRIDLEEGESKALSIALTTP